MMAMRAAAPRTAVPLYASKWRSCVVNGLPSTGRKCLTSSRPSTFVTYVWGFAYLLVTGPVDSRVRRRENHSDVSTSRPRKTTRWP